MALSDSQIAVIEDLSRHGACAIDQFWLLTVCSLKKAGLATVYARTISVQGERKGKAFIALTPLGWETAESLGVHTPISGLADD